MHYRKPITLLFGNFRMLMAARYRPKDYYLDVERWDPLTAGASATLGILTDFTSAFGGVFINPFKEMNRVRSAGGGDDSAGLAAAIAVSKGVTLLGSSLSKGAFVGMPLALAEGLRNAPRLYGDQVKDHGRITDWKSGGIVAAKVCTSRDQQQPTINPLAEFWIGILRRYHGYSV
jgi:sterol 3beta-glucosyltransferase